MGYYGVKIISKSRFMNNVFYAGGMTTAILGNSNSAGCQQGDGHSMMKIEVVC